MKRTHTALALALAGVIGLAGCTSGGTAEPEGGGALVIVTATEPTTLNAAEVAVQGDMMTVMRNVIQTLVGRDSETNELVPELATAWENPSPTEWVFTLREGVTFHDGSVFDAAAAVASLEANYASDVPGSGDFVGSPATFEAVDDYTVKMTTEAPDPLVPTRMTMIAISSAEQLTSDPESLITDAIGTGPYRLTEWKPGEYMDFELIPDNWQAVEGMPSEVRWIWRAEASVRAQMIQTGEADVTNSLTDDQCTIGTIECRPQNAAVINVLRIDSYNQPGLLGDPRVRQAIAYAIDRPALSEAFFSGVPVLNNLSPAGSTGVDESIDLYQYNPDTAAELLAEAVASGADLSLPVTVKFYDGIPNGANIAAVITDSLTGLGLNMQSPVPVARDDMAAAYLTNFDGRTLEADMPTNRGELWITGSGNELFDAAITASYLLICSGGQSTFCDKSIDAQWEAANAAVGDERGELLRAMWLDAYENQVPILPLAQKTNLYSFTDRIEVPTRSDNILPLWEARFAQ